jgi:hypothetical protein
LEEQEGGGGEPGPGEDEEGDGGEGEVDAAEELVEAAGRPEGRVPPGEQLLRDGEAGAVGEDALEGAGALPAEAGDGLRDGDGEEGCGGGEGEGEDEEPVEEEAARAEGVGGERVVQNRRGRKAWRKVWRKDQRARWGWCSKR